MSILKIKGALETDGIMSSTGKGYWSERAIDMILLNNKYCGLSAVKAGDKVLLTPVCNIGLRPPCHTACMLSVWSESSLKYDLVTDLSSEYSIKQAVANRRKDSLLRKIITALVLRRTSLVQPFQHVE